MLSPATRCRRWALAMVVSGAVTINGADWTVTYQDTVDLNTGAFSVQELSGVTPYPFGGSGLASFLAISDEDGVVTEFELDLGNGGIISATAVDQWSIADTTLDTEGIAFHLSEPDSVLIAYERDTASGQNIPGVREYDLMGQRLATLNLPEIWTTPGNVRSNRGFESLARSSAGGVLWAANEEALTIDGPTATQTSGTAVRIQKFSVGGSSRFPTSQFVYEVDPVHGSNPDRSGLVELVALPDGNLLALERSAAAVLPIFENRIYQIDFDQATDVSVASFDAGLNGTTYTPVTKELLWSGSVSGLTGANLEGLTVVPTGNSWALVGVVDNGGGTNNNLIVAFALEPQGAYADFNRDGSFDCDDIDSLILEIIAGSNAASFDLTGDGLVNGADQTAWLAAAATANDFTGAYRPSDANLDGQIDGQDFVAWNSNKFTTNKSWCAGNFNHDAVTDGQDFVVWNDNKFSFTPADVPETSPYIWVPIMGLCVFRRLIGTSYTAKRA